MTIRHYKVKEWNRFDIEIQEALVKKYDLILTDYKEPKGKALKIGHLFNQLTKTNKGIPLMICFKIGKAIYSQLTQKNLDKVIFLIHKGTGLMSEFGKAFDNPKKGHSRKSSFNQNAFWGNDKPNKRTSKSMSFYGEKMPFSSSKKIGF